MRESHNKELCIIQFSDISIMGWQINIIIDGWYILICHIVLIIKVYFKLILMWNILKPQMLPSNFKLMVADKGPYTQSYIFSSSQVWIKELDHKESWAPKNLCFWIMVLKKSPLQFKEIKPVNPKGKQPWIFIGRNDAKASILWSPDAKSQLIGKDPDAGKDWGKEEKGVTEDEMIGWHHWLHGNEFEQSQGVSEGQGSLTYCSSWGCKEWDMT